MILVNKDGSTTYPYSFGQLRNDHPQVSFPSTPRVELLAEFGVYPVARVARPAPSDPMSRDVVEVSPTLVGGTWTQTWGEVDVSPAEVQNRLNIATDAAHKEIVKLDAFVATFIGMTPAQVETYVTSNTNNLVEIRTLLVRMGKMLLLLARRELR